VNEELRRHAVQLLAHVLADAQQRLAARAGLLLDLVAVLDARQARRQRYAATVRAS